MAFADSPQAQDETARAALQRGLIRMGDDARIEQRRRFEGILVQEVGADELALYLGQRRLRGVNDLHGVGAGLEGASEPPVAPLEVLEHLGQLPARGLGIERQHPIDDVSGPRPIRRVEFPRLGGRLEVAHHHSRRIGTQTEGLTVE